MDFFRAASVPVWAALACLGLGFHGSQALANSSGPDTPLEDARAVAVAPNDSAFGFAILSDAIGNLVAVYPSFTDDQARILARRFRADGSADELATQINTRAVTPYTGEADAAMNAAGRFVVVWEGPDDRGSDTLYGQRYDAQLNAMGEAFVINQSPISNRARPAVDIGANGEIAVTWTTSSGPDAELFLRRYDAAGQPTADETAVTDGGLTALESDVALAPSGTAVVAFVDSFNPTQGIYLQRFDASGGRIGKPIRADAPSRSRADFPSLAVDGSGNALVAWSVDPDDTIEARLFNAAFEPAADPFVIASHTFYSDVAAYANGGFAVVAEGADDVYVTALRSADQAVEPVLVYSGVDPDASRVAADADGDYAVFWTEDSAGESEPRLFVRRFAGPENVDLSASLVADATQVGPGASIGYRLTVDNNHDPVAPIDTQRAEADTLNRAIGAATGVIATLKLPAGLTNVVVEDVTAPQDRTLECDREEKATVVCRLAGALFAGESVSARVTAHAPTRAQTLRTGLSATANQVDADEAQDMGNNSDAATVTIGERDQNNGATDDTAHDNNDGGSGGGGCTMATSSGPVDPLFILLLFGAGAAIATRRRHGRA